MMEKINKLLYDDRFFAIIHWIVGILIMGIVCILLKKSEIIPIGNFSLLVNTDIISLSATIAGFELAGVALLISLNGNNKFQDIKSIGSDKTIYKLFFHSIILLTLSILLMISDIYLFQTVGQEFLMYKSVMGYCSVLLFGQGLVFFLSSIRMLILIFK